MLTIIEAIADIAEFTKAPEYYWNMLDQNFTD